MGYDCAIRDSGQWLPVGPEPGDCARSLLLLLSLQCPDHPRRAWDITWKGLLVFPAEESVRADLPAGFDLPFVVQAERVCACAQTRTSPGAVCQTHPVAGNRTNPSPPVTHSDKPWVCRRAAAAKELPCSERRPDLAPSSSFPTWTALGHRGALDERTLSSSLPSHPGYAPCWTLPTPQPPVSGEGA